MTSQFCGWALQTSRLRLQHGVSIFLCFLAFALVCEGINVAYMPCGSTVPVDSQFIFDPVWSITPYRDAIRRTSGVNLVVGKGSISPNVRNIIKTESGMDPDMVTLFYLNRNANSAPSLASSSDGGSRDGSAADATCTIRLDPLRAGLAGTQATALRLVFVEIGDAAAGGACGTLVNTTMLVNGQSSDAILHRTSDVSLRFAQSLTFGPGNSSALTWPGSVTFPAVCQVSLLVLTDRHGRIDTWYTWIPTTVYTAVVTALIIPAVLTTGHVPLSIVVLEIVFVFMGYLGSCIGLMVELISWQSAVGRMFPFPSSVTLYTCLCVLYALYLVPLVYRQGHYRIMLMGVLRLLIYGLNIGLCVGYWISGYVLLGSLAIFQYVVTNFILTLYFACVTVKLRDASCRDGSVRFAHVFIYMWFIPATPFAVCGLLYSDLYTITKYGNAKKPGEARMRDLVYAYNAQMSIPLIIFQNIYGVALVAAATAFHMPFVVALFIALWLFGLHIVYVIDIYVGACRRWRSRGVVGLGSFACCGWLSLSPVVGRVLGWPGGARGYGAPPPTPRGGGAHETRSATSPMASSDRVASHGGMSDRRWQAASVRQQSLSQSLQTGLDPGQSGRLGSVAYAEDDGAIYFPPLPTGARETTTPMGGDFVPPRSDRYRYDAHDERPTPQKRSQGGEAAGDYHDPSHTLSPQDEGEEEEDQFWPTDVGK